MCSDMIPVSIRAKPLGRAVTKREPEGATVAAIVARSGIGEALLGHTQVCIRGTRIPRNWWHAVRPRAVDNAIVEISVVPSGGDGVLTGLNFLAAGVSLVNPFAGFALAVGGRLVVQTIGDIFGSNRQKGGLAGQTAGTQLNAAGTSLNPITPFEQIWRVLGTFNVAPQMIAQPYTDLEGEDQVVYMLFGLAGPHTWNTTYVNQVDTADQTDQIEVQTRQGLLSDTQNTLVTKSVRPEVVNLEASRFRFLFNKPTGERYIANAGATTAEILAAKSKPHVFTTSANPDEAWITLSFPNGLYETPTAVVSLGVRIRLRKRGGSWRNGPELRLQGSQFRPFKYMIKLIWSGTEPSSSPPATGKRCYKAMRDVDEQAAGASLPGNGDYDADPWFGSSGRDASHVFVYDERLEIYLGPDDATDPWPQGQYDVEILIGLGVTGENTDAFARHFDLNGVDGSGYFINDTQTGQSHRVVIESFQAVENTYPVSDTGIALLAVKANNTQVNSVTADVSGMVPVKTAGVWGSVAAVSTNPAAFWRDGALDSLGIGLNAEPVTTAIIDEASIDAWYDFCVTNSIAINALWQGGSGDALRKFCAAMGQAREAQSDKWGVSIEQDRSAEDPVQLFTPRNSRNFKGNKAFEKRPHALNISYQDAADEYRTTPRTVYDDGFSSANATRFEGKELKGKVTAAEVDAFGLLELRQRRLRATSYALEVWIESLISTRGDLVGLSHDMISHRHSFARVVSVQTSGANVTGLTLDADLNLGGTASIWTPPNVWTLTNIWSTPDAQVAMRYDDGSVVVKAIDETTDTDVVTFTTPFAIPAGLVPGSLVSCGPASNEFKRMIIFDMEPGPEGTARLLLKDEAPAIHA